LDVQDEKKNKEQLLAELRAMRERIAELEKERAEHMQADEALRESQQMLHLVLDTIPVRVFWKDLDLRYLGCNRPFALDAGLSAPEEIMGKDDFEMGWVEQAELYRSDDRLVMETGLPKVGYEEPQTMPDGGRIWLRTSKVPLFNPEGKVKGVLGTYEDITERKRVEEALQKSEERMRLFFERQLVGMAITSPEKGWLKVNDKLSRMLGYSPEELSEWTWAELTHPEDLSADESQFQRLLAGEIDDYAMEKRFIRKDGAIICTNLSVGCVRRQDGTVDYVLALLEDITERKQAEESLRKYERIVSTSQDLIALISRDYVYEAVNDSLMRTHNKTREELVGKTVFEIFGESAFREMVLPYFEQALSGRTVRYRITHDFAGTGRRTIDATYFPVFHDTGKVTGLVLNARDITETRKLEEQLMQSQKIESIGTLAGGVAHEINNPINGIMNYAQLIMDRTGEDHPANEFAKEILHETQRIAGIVRNLLTFARHEKQSHSPAQLADVISAVLSLIQTVMRHDQITLELAIPEDLPKIKCRSQQIQQVLMNLMTNARDALNERYPGYNPNKALRIAAEVITKLDRRFIRTTVEDTGKGIPKKIRDRIFDPFFTTKPKETGTGLGLSISYGIVRDHGGELSVESIAGRYTRFHMDLPVDNGWILAEK
jgi:PAS domain S-box-containing protein